MIGYLTGEVINTSKQSLTLLCGQIGYEVFCTPKLLNKIEINNLWLVESYIYNLFHIGEEKTASYQFFIEFPIIWTQEKEN